MSSSTEFIVADDIAYIPSTSVVWGRNPFDLHRRTLTFTPAAGGGYRVRNEPLSYEADRGVLLQLSGTREYEYAKYQLSKFTFPFGGRSVNSFYVTRFHALRFLPEEVLLLGQYREFSALQVPGGVISPFLTTRRNASYLPDVFVRETDSSLTLTWRLLSSAESWRYELQTVLQSDGTIRFSYISVSAERLRSGTLVISAGNESWRTEVETLAETSDPAGNVPSGDKHQFADITSVAIKRVAQSKWLRMEVALARVVDAKAFEQSGDRLGVHFSIPTHGGSRVSFAVIVDGTGPHVGRYEPYDTLPTVSLNGNMVTLELAQDLVLPSEATSIRVLTVVSPTGNGTVLNQVSLNTPIRPAKPLAVNFAEITDETVVGPLVEAFTLGHLFHEDAWELVQDRLGLRDSGWDAIAIYTAFPTDIEFAGYSGFASSGNAAVDGIGIRATGALAREATILVLGQAPLRDSDLKWHIHLLLHEFGHRWLYSARFMKDGVSSSLLAPLTSHPAEWVDTRAAFPVHSSMDSSAMGGGYFVEKDGAFKTETINTESAVGYSWVDLYLMGLAAPEEVPPLFYIANSYPPLGPDYYPSPRTYTGERHDVLMSEIVAAMGVRKPSSATSPRLFRIAFTVVVASDDPVDEREAALVGKLRTEFIARFRAATGNRGGIYFALSQGKSRRRAVAH